VLSEPRLIAAGRLLAALVACWALLLGARWIVASGAPLGAMTPLARMSLPTAGSLIALAAGTIFRPGGDGLAQGRLRNAVLVTAIGVPVIVSLAVIARTLLGNQTPGTVMGPAVGQVSRSTAMCLLLLGAALLAATRKGWTWVSILTSMALFVSLLALVGTLFDGDAIRRSLGFETMAVSTAICCALMAVAMLLVTVRNSWLRYLLDPGQARRVFLLMMPAALVPPIGLSWILDQAVRENSIEIPVGLALYAVITAFLLGAMVTATCRWVAHADAVAGLYTAIVESSDDAIVGKTRDGVITSWNRGAERLFGYARDEAIGQKMELVFPPDRLAEERDILERIGRNERVQHFLTQRLRKDGLSVAVSTTVSPILSASGEVVGASSITRDVSEQQRKDEELRRSNAELEQFAYVASHDLQEPMRMVANYVELLAERYSGALDERADKYIRFASEGARRMQHLVSDLLAYSRLGSRRMRMAAVDTRRCLAHAVQSLDRTIAETGATIDTGDLPTVRGDPGMLDLVFQNLLGNAIKFRSDAAPVIRVGAVREGEEWRFTVADNGIGIDMQFADRIFQMFQRLHERSRYDGSGMGLAIVKRIVEQHEGRVWIVSAPGGGTQVHFTLRGLPKRENP